MNVVSFAKDVRLMYVASIVDFVFRVIHTEMDSFFTEHSVKFDQDWEDFSQQGETLEQFQVRGRGINHFLIVT